MGDGGPHLYTMVPGIPSNGVLSIWTLVTCKKSLPYRYVFHLTYHIGFLCPFPSPYRRYHIMMGEGIPHIGTIGGRGRKTPCTKSESSILVVAAFPYHELHTEDRGYGGPLSILSVCSVIMVWVWDGH